MSTLLQKSLLYVTVFLCLVNFSKSQENRPASPSSSYNNEYHNKGKVIEEEKKIILPKNTQLVVQGNNRLDSSVVIRDSLLNMNKLYV